MRKFLILTAVAAATAAASSSVGAATTNATFTVSATVNATCSATAGNLTFPAYTPAAGAQTATSAISVKCTNKTAFTVALNAGTTTGTTMAQRLLNDGAGDTLQYNLYTSTTHNTVLGDGTNGSQQGGGTGTGVNNAIAVNVYGQLPDSTTNQAAVPGNYSDTITVTVTY